MANPQSNDLEPKIDMATLRRAGPYASPCKLARWLLGTLGDGLGTGVQSAAQNLAQNPPRRAPEEPGTFGVALADRHLDDLARLSTWFPDVAPPAEDAELPAWSDYAAAVARRVSRSPYRFARQDRLHRADRVRLGLGDLTRSEYKQRFQAARRLRGAIAHAERVEAEAARRPDTVSWEGLLGELGQEEFARDGRTAFLIVLHLASVQPSGSRSPNGYTWDAPTDAEAAAALHLELWQACQRHQAATNWWALAHVWPTAPVLRHLTEKERGTVLGRWSRALLKEASALRAFWQVHDIDAGAMVLQRGVDGAAWNRMADRWERLRCGWIQALHGSGLEAALASHYPTRVPRMRRHQSPGPAGAVYRHQIHRDAKVWAQLARPWDVVRGAADMQPAAVVAACGRVGIDAYERGWLLDLPDASSRRPGNSLLDALRAACPQIHPLLGLADS